VPLAVQNCWPPPKPPSGGPPDPPSPVAPASLAAAPPQQIWLSEPQGEPLVLLHDPAAQVPETPVPAQA
jgi:hypothetical protein